MSKRKWLLDLLTPVVGDKVKAEMVLDILTKEGVLHLGYGDADVDKILEAFSTTFGTTKTSKFDRFAASRMANKYGSQAVCGVIKLLSTHGEERFAPVVGNVAQLEDKWVSVISFLRNLSVSQEVLDI